MTLGTAGPAGPAGPIGLTGPAGAAGTTVSGLENIACGSVGRGSPNLGNVAQVLGSPPTASPCLVEDDVPNIFCPHFQSSVNASINYAEIQAGSVAYLDATSIITPITLTSMTDPSRWPSCTVSGAAFPGPGGHLRR